MELFADLFSQFLNLKTDLRKLGFVLGREMTHSPSSLLRIIIEIEGCFFEAIVDLFIIS
jgi:hypothetical protein